jgi:hypothetical protein
LLGGERRQQLARVGLNVGQPLLIGFGVAG